VADTLTNAIACRLDPEEQKQAAAATIEATRGAEGGDADRRRWVRPPRGRSETRENVSGTSTVVARNDNDKGGMQCITVSDVIIVNGEETTADKRMCRRPGSGALCADGLMMLSAAHPRSVPARQSVLIAAKPGSAWRWTRITPHCPASARLGQAKAIALSAADMDGKHVLIADGIIDSDAAKAAQGRTRCR